MRNRFSACIVLAALSAFAGIAHGQTHFYDDAGRLIRTVYPNGVGLAYSYDDADNMVSATSVALPGAPTNVQATRTSANQVRLTWAAGSNDASTFVIMRRLQDGDDWVEIATVTSAFSFIDPNVAPANEYLYRVAARGGTGLSAYSRDVHPSSRSAVEVNVQGGGTQRLLSQGSASQVRAGYANVSLDIGGTPYGTAVFSFTQNGAVVSEAGVPASPPTTRARIFIDYRTGVRSASNQFSGSLDIRTGFAIVNPGRRQAKLTFRLRRTDGQTLAFGSATLAAGAHTSKFLDELQSIAPDFLMPGNFSTAVGYGSLEVESDQSISILALRMTANQRGELLFTSTPVADLTTPSSSEPVYFPHFADGGGYSTFLVLLNSSASIQSGAVEIFATNGSPHLITVSDGRTGSSFEYTIQPGGAFVLETNGSPASVTVGSVRVTPAPSSESPFGAGVFRLSQRGVVVSESGIPSARLTTRARIYVDRSGGHDTGLAVSNPSSQPGVVSVRAFQTDGTSTVGSTATINLGARGQRANLAGELITGLPSGFSGVLEISSPTPFAALTVRLLTNARGEALLTTFPIADFTRPAPSPVLFPQIADGGGFQTELILLSPHGALTAVVRYYDSNGLPLDAANVP